MEMKVEQFLKLQQGGQSVLDYLGMFNHVSQYAQEHVSTDANKKRYFLRGLNTKLWTMMTGCITATFNEIVSIAISSEETYRLHKESKKRKNVPMGFSSGNNQRRRIVYQPFSHPPYRPPQ